MEYNPFTYFKVRKEKSLISSLELDFKIELPPIFKLFNETFEIESLKSPTDFHLCHPNEELGFDSFDHSIEDLFRYYSEEGNNEKHHFVFPFATSGMHSAGICVGTKGDIKDKIGYPNEMNDWKFEIVNENIFEFVNDLILFNFKNDKTYANTVYSK